MQSRQRIMLRRAYVLHQYDWRETSRLVEIFTSEHGKLGLVARGTRRVNSPWRAILRPFQPLLLSWMGTKDLGTLIGAETCDVPYALSGRALMSGFYVNELLIRLLPRHDPHPELFIHYENALAHLTPSLLPALRIFEKHLLTALGYGLNLECEAITGEPLDKDAMYRYTPEQGPIRVQSRTDAGNNIKGGTLLALANEDICYPDQLRDARQLMQTALDQLLDGRPLKSRQFMRALEKVSIPKN